MIYFAIGLLVLFIFWKIYRSRYFEEVEASLDKKPLLLSQPIEILYKHHVGPYSKSNNHINTIKSIVPAGTDVVAIYYDDPEQVDEDLCQSAVGCVVAVGDRKVLEPHFVTQLSRCGYERMTVPAIGRIVFINNFMKPGSWLSNLRIARRCYPTLRKFLKDINIDSSVNVEIHYEDRTHIFSPIDDQKEFVVPEYRPIEDIINERIHQQFYSDSDTDDSDEEVGGESEEESDVEESEQLAV